MTDEYVPDYAPGEIMVNFQDYAFVEMLPNLLANADIRLIQHEYKISYPYTIYQVPRGEEKKIVDEISNLAKQFPKTIHWADLRDLEWERRDDFCKSLEELVRNEFNINKVEKLSSQKCVQKIDEAIQFLEAQKRLYE